MHATKLEKAIFNWIAGRNPSLAPRLKQVGVASREYTGVGYYVNLLRERLDLDRPPVDGPVIKSSQLDAGAGSMLWLSKGEPACLEIYAFGNNFPAVLYDFHLSGSERDV